jgi:L-rhamnose mutarotase
MSKNTKQTKNNIDTKKILTLIVFVIVTFTMTFTMLFSASTYVPAEKTVQTYYEKHQDKYKELTKNLSENNASLEIQDNNLIYTFDYSDDKYFTDSITQTDEFNKMMDEMFEESLESKKKLAESISSQSKVKDVNITYRYVHNGNTVYERTYSLQSAEK